MYAQFYFVRLLVCGLYIFAHLYLLGLWSFAFLRLGKNFLLLLAMTSVLAVFFGVVNTAFALNIQLIRSFDPSNILYGTTFFALQPFIVLLNVIGLTLFVKWASRKTSGEENTASVPNPSSENPQPSL